MAYASRRKVFRSSVGKMALMKRKTANLKSKRWPAIWITNVDAVNEANNRESHSWPDNLTCWGSILKTAISGKNCAEVGIVNEIQKGSFLCAGRCPYEWIWRWGREMSLKKVFRDGKTNIGRPADMKRGLQSLSLPISTFSPWFTLQPCNRCTTIIHGT